MKRVMEERTERGQILVILVIAAVVVIAFVGLAVDGSLIYSERRVTQSVADMAAINAARAMCQDENIQDAVNTVLANNGFVVNENNMVEVNNPPSDPKYEGNPDYIEVIVYTKSASSLVSTVYEGEMEVTSKAVAKCEVVQQQGGGTVAGDFSIIALKNTGRHGIDLTGSGLISTDGGVYVNSDDSSRSVEITGDGRLYANILNVYGGCRLTGSSEMHGYSQLYVNEGCTTTGTSFTNPGTPLSGIGRVTDPLISVAPPTYPSQDSFEACTDFNESGWGINTIEPGCYTGIRQSGAGDLYLNPGTYYVFGDINVSGSVSIYMDHTRIIMVNGDFSKSGWGRIWAQDFFIYLRTGEFITNGSPDVILTTPVAGDPWHGMLIYLDRSNTNDFVFNGDMQTSIIGTIYAPSSHFKITGSAGITTPLTAQLIGQDFDVSGAGKIYLHYDSNYFYPVTQPVKQVELVE